MRSYVRTVADDRLLKKKYAENFVRYLIAEHFVNNWLVVTLRMYRYLLINHLNILKNLKIAYKL